MKTFPALYIDPQGVVRYIAECPEEPQNICRRCKGKGWIAGAEYPCGLCNPGGEWRSSKSSIQRYSEALAAAKQSSIEVQDQNAGWILGLPRQKDTIYPLPTGWKVEVKPGNICLNCGEPNCVSLLCFDSDGHAGYEQVAILTPDPIPDSGEKVESQEELWAEAEETISCSLGTIKTALTVTMASWVRSALEKRYNLTRKP